MLECPKRRDTVGILTPSAIKSVACVCRRECGVKCGRLLRFTNFRTQSVTLYGFIGVESTLVNNRSLGRTAEVTVNLKGRMRTEQIGERTSAMSPLRDGGFEEVSEQLLRTVAVAQARPEAYLPRS